MTTRSRRRVTGPTSRRGLAAQAALAMAAVVAVALGLTGTVALQLVRGAAERQAVDSLTRQASIIAGLVRDPDDLAQSGQRLAQRLRLGRQNIALLTLPATGSSSGRFADVVGPADRSALQRGEQVSGLRRRAGTGQRWLVAGRPVAGGGAVVLLERASVAGGVTADARRRILAALLVGLLGATAAGFLLTRRLARPLQEAAAAAHDLAGGRRDVRLRAEGPAELADLSRSLNTLAAALARSEGRQRDFLLSISHELRTPLTAIRGFAEALADGVVPAAEAPATGRVMSAESARLERIVSDLLDLARLTATDFRLEPTDVDLSDLVRDAGRVWSARAAAADVPLRLELPAAPVWARADPTRLRQVLDGLAENALRVTPAGRPLVFAVRADGDGAGSGPRPGPPGGQADHGAGSGPGPAAAGGQAVLEVRDGGPGLTDDDLQVAFERSALYDRYRGVRRVGTGVGLALVAGLTARMGGQAVAGHAAEGGARFTIQLPVSQPQPTAVAGRQP